jgi:hypothetical protein
MACWQCCLPQGRVDGPPYRPSRSQHTGQMGSESALAPRSMGDSPAAATAAAAAAVLMLLLLCCLAAVALLCCWVCCCCGDCRHHVSVCSSRVPARHHRNRRRIRSSECCDQVLAVIQGSLLGAGVLQQNDGAPQVHVLSEQSCLHLLQTSRGYPRYNVLR